MISLDALSNDLAGWLARVLVAPGLLDPVCFEDAFVAIVESVSDDPVEAWLAFYRNTLRALRDGGMPGGTNAEFAAVHDRAATLAVGQDMVDLGCGFGFLALRLASVGHRATAVDVSPGTVALLARMSRLLDLHVDVVAGDARAAPLAAGSADTVLAIHLLEHVPERSWAGVLSEMLRIARRRVVVAVPYEPQPNPTWGHVSRFDRRSLQALGDATRLPFEVSDHHGGWLVVEC